MWTHLRAFETILAFWKHFFDRAARCLVTSGDFAKGIRSQPPGPQPPQPQALSPSLDLSLTEAENRWMCGCSPALQSLRNCGAALLHRQLSERYSSRGRAGNRWVEILIFGEPPKLSASD